MKALRFGICGCGGIAGLHAKCLKSLEGSGLATLVAGAEEDETRRKGFGEKWGIGMHESLAALLKRDDIDAVSVCSPSGMHARHVMEIAKSKRHILCEKPLDTRLERADEAIVVAKENGVVLGGIFQQRFAPGPAKVKRAIEKGLFGEIVFVHCETPWYREQKYYDSGAWRGTWDLDGGVLSNQAPHMIDRLIWLGGDVEEVISATCEAGKMRKIEAETVAVATVRLVNGALGTITGTTLAYDGLPQRVLICGTDGSAGFSGDELVYFKTRQPFEEDVLATQTGKAKDGTASDPLAISADTHLLNITDFVNSILEKRKPLVDGVEMRKVTRVLNMIYRKAGVGPYGV